MRIFIPFFQYTYKIKKYAVFFKTLNLDIHYMKNTKLMHIFEKMSLIDREFFLKLLHQFLLSDIDVIKQLLKQAGTTHKTLQGKMHSFSQTILYLSKHLKDAKNSSAKHSKRNTIKPRDKDEVNRLYGELLQYI